MAKSQQSKNEDREYGEGNYKAAKQYQRGATKTAQEGPEEAAKEAKRAMENPKEREALERAAEKVKRGRS
jgi:hypothetical protein